jgi:hypothetical protein
MEMRGDSERRYIKGYGEIYNTQNIDGVKFETLGSRVANMVNAIVHPELTRQKYRIKINEIPKFIELVNYMLSISAKSIEEQESIKKDVEIILRDYPVLLKKAISEDPETRKTIERETSPKLKEIRQEARAKAQERADKGEDFNKAYECEMEVLFGDMVSAMLQNLYLGEKRNPDLGK